MATEQELLTARLYLRAVLPVMKVLLEDDPGFRRRFAKTRARVQFVARDPSGPVGARVEFEEGAFQAIPELGGYANLTFRFPTVAKMNAFFRGKPVLPSIRGFWNVRLLCDMLRLLMAMKLLMPDRAPKTPEQARLKVKMTLFMVSTALSQLNKAGDPDMMRWTRRQPERIYQWSVEPEGIACYLRVKAGQTQAGRGHYTRRQPFVHMRFNGVDGALPVLSNSVDTLEAIARGLVVNEGSPEYSTQLGDFMLRIAALLSG